MTYHSHGAIAGGAAAERQRQMRFAEEAEEEAVVDVQAGAELAADGKKHRKCI